MGRNVFNTNINIHINTNFDEVLKFNLNLHAGHLVRMMNNYSKCFLNWTIVSKPCSTLFSKM